jgi:Plasmid encoded RepA protein
MGDGRDDGGRGGELTPMQRRRLRSSLDTRETPAQHIVYQHTVLCQTALPYRDPGEDVREWERQQGAVALKVHAGEARDPSTGRFVKLGLPFGSRPRLILAHLNREALLRGSPRIDVEGSLTAFIRRIQRADPNGKEIRRFKDQLARLAAALVRLAVGLSEDRTYQVNTQIIDAFELWLEKDERQRVLWPAVVELSPRYFDSLARHAVPLDERAIAALANSPLALDVYCWLAQRLHRIAEGKPQRVTWKALHEQFGDGYTRPRKFRESFLAVLSEVHAQYRGARLSADGQGLELRHSPPPVLCRHSPVIRGQVTPAGRDGAGIKPLE